jgi:hypothetical protein
MKLQATVYLMFFLLYSIVVSKNNKENEHLIDIFTSGDLVMENISLCIFCVWHCLSTI